MGVALEKAKRTPPYVALRMAIRKSSPPSTSSGGICRMRS
jgi:hypothetical protein